MTVEIQPKEYHELTDTEIKELLNEWSKTKKLVTTNFGDLVAIVRKTNKEAYESTLETEYETRKIEDRRAPYMGEAVDDSGEIPDMWDIVVPETPIDFKRDSYTIRLPHSDSVSTCSICKGQGTIVCPRCDGLRELPCDKCHTRGEIICKSCSGAGKIRCSRCGGHGYLKHSEDSAVDILIGHEGQAGDRCPNCHGEGELVCRSCGGAGYVTCQECYGKGYITCSRCSGMGYITCNVCDGMGKNIYWSDVVIDFSYDTDVKIFDEGGKLEKVPETTGKDLIGKVLIEDRSASRYFMEKADLNVNNLLIEDIEQKLLDLPVIDEKIMPQIVEMFKSEDANYMSKENCKRLFQELSVLYFPITEIVYSYKDKTYEAWVYGSNKCVYIEKAPNAVLDKVGDFGKKVKGLFKRKER